MTTKPETDLLLNCARSKINSQAKTKIARSLEKEIDWKYLLEISRRHKVSNLIYANLSNLKLGGIDPAIYRDFNKVFQANIQRNLLLTSELLKVLNFLKTNEVIAIPFKGTILARLAYSNFGLRSVSDIDLIVRHKDFDATQQLLVQYGYKANPNNNEAYYQQAQYYKPSGIVGIDLHYEFAPKNHFARVNSDSFWGNLENLEIANQKITIFSLNYTIVHLCLEGAKEHWRFLSRICDLSELIYTQEVDWQALLETAETLDKKASLFLGLYLAGSIFDTPIPKDVWLLITNKLRVRLSYSQICDFLFRRKTNLLIAVKWHLFNLQVFDSFADKLKYLTQVTKVNLKVNLINKLKK